MPQRNLSEMAAPVPLPAQPFRSSQQTADPRHLAGLRSELRTAGLRLLLAVGSLLGVANWASAQQLVDRIYRDDQGEHRYEVFVPAGYSASQPAPMILFLHGAGECGKDGRKPAMVGLGPYAQAWGKDFPFLVVFPQVETEQGQLLDRWAADGPDGQRALKILDAAQQEFSATSPRVALVGWSMGGYGAWNLGAAHPERWSAVVALSGGGDPQSAVALKEVPVWAFHGARDALVPVAAGKAMADSLAAAGGNVTWTEFPQGGHDIFAETFGNPGLIRWLQEPATAPRELAKTSPKLSVPAPPFVPVLDIPQAVGVRLGNDFLKSLSYAIPSQIPPSMLIGRLNDMFDSTQAQGRNFSVRFSGISYQASLERVQIQASGPDRVTVQLGLRNITLSIAGTSVSGARQSAYAGPIAVGIGHNRAVWLNIDVAPYVENRRLRLRLLGSSFSIPPDTYYVTQPAGVSVRGLGMTQERVVSGLVNGLYGARGRVENEVRAIVPNIVQELERQLVVSDPGPMVAGLWPLPVYAPRLQGYPEQVRTDAQGISIVMGLTAASYDPTAQPGKVQQAPAGGLTADQLQGTQLGMAVAPEILEPLSQLLIDNKLARINVMDLPDAAFHRLADRATLTEILPDLKRLGDDVALQTDLLFSSAMTVNPLEIPAGEQRAALKLGLPRALLQVSTRSGDSAQPWKPYAEFELSIDDQLVAALEAPSHTRRRLDLMWDKEAQISGNGRYVATNVPAEAKLDDARMVELFRDSWNQWTRNSSVTGITVPDLEFGPLRVRIDQLATYNRAISTVFDIPTIKLTNLSEEPFVYQTKGPYSAWSETYTLAPGKSQDYLIPYPLTYRRVGAGQPDRPQEVYTLRTGTHSEYRVPLKGGPPQLFTAREPD